MDMTGQLFREDLKAREYAMEVYHNLAPKDVKGRDFIRVGRPNDGGYLMVNDKLIDSIAYSMGINDDVSWDLHMAILRSNIFQYDHTISGLPIQHPHFHWFQLGIGPISEGNIVSIKDAVTINNHLGSDMVLKMDIEGAEWDVLASIPEHTLSQFRQILIELHGITNLDSRQKIIAVLEKLNKYHQVVHIHANNYGPLALISGVTLPDVIEVTYLRKNDYEFIKTHKIFPTKLDMPCNRDFPDYFLGALGSLAGD